MLGEVATREIEVEVVPKFGAAEVERMLQELRKTTRLAQEAQAEASAQMRAAVQRLRGDLALPVRDVATLLGVSHQRISQLSH